MSECSGFTDELDSVLEHESISEFDHVGHSNENVVQPAKGSAANDVEDECSHPVIFNSMCATCFKHIEEVPGDSIQAGGDSKVNLRYLGLKVSQNHLKEQSEQQMKHLLNQKKLVVVLDLDHTMLHTELKSRLKPQVIEEIQRMRHSQKMQNPDMSDASDTPACSEAQPDAAASRKRARDNAPGDSTTADPVATGDVGADVAPADLYSTVYDNGDSFTKLRPGAFEMLAALQQCCELRIFTMGDSRYACMMASLLDASGALFRNRIVARDDANPQGLKGLEKAGAMPPLTAIIDDTVDVWRAELGNLIRIPRYHFFLPGGFGVVERALDEDPRSGPLATITRLLLDVHARFFNPDPTSTLGAPLDPRRPHAHGMAPADADADAAAGAAAPESGGAGPGDEAVQGGCHASAGSDDPGSTGTGRAVGRAPPKQPASADAPSEPPKEAACGGRSATLAVSEAAADETHAIASARPAGTAGEHAADGRGPAEHVPPELRDVRRVLDDMRRNILHGCVVTFSGVFDASVRAAPEKHALWQLALALGASCCGEVAAATTHLVTLSLDTDKARAALHQDTKLVSPDWLLACECGWKRLLEEDFPAPDIPYTLWRQKVGQEHVQAMLLRGRV